MSVYLDTESSLMSDELYKFVVGERIWLVPEYLVTTFFRSAVEKLNHTKPGESMGWSTTEMEAFKKVGHCPDVWIGSI